MTPEEYARQLVRITQDGRDLTDDELDTVEGRVYVHIGDAFSEDDSWAPGMVRLGRGLRAVIATTVREAVEEATRERAALSPSAEHDGR